MNTALAPLSAIVMAAGQGTRMNSRVPKVLHRLCGRPLLYFPVRAALDLGAEAVVVVVGPETGPLIESELIRLFPDARLTFAVQTAALGTGDAVRAGMAALPRSSGAVLILSGDTPLLEASDLHPLLSGLDEGAALALVTFEAEEPTGYGRVLRDHAGRPTAICEERDLSTAEQRAVTEVNAGIYLAARAPLADALTRLMPDNSQAEYYLTDIVRLLAPGARVSTASAPAAAVLGVNDRAQLARAEALLHARVRLRLAQSGVTIVGSPLIDDSVLVEPDARIEDGVRLRGATQVGAGTLVDVGCVLDDATIGRCVTVKPYTVVTQSIVEDGAVLGPFAHLRPDSHIEAGAHIGNFVETKKTRVRRGAKANHLAYLGDADIGEDSNVGAGTVICNYDGFAKRRTVLGKGVFVGSDSQLIAPVTLGDGAYVATGTTVTEDVPAGALAIGRVKQSNKLGYAEPLRARLAAQAQVERGK